ncbi:hypothetical protein BKA61DRAFT_275665 [Leptodontidium sp. MPI-SDFR-AT-0119]|nr:hypothetical protein BKA61DRAFT_275665 [Leptodontidium sp. MPI-SDFR-AT-0119]
MISIWMGFVFFWIDWGFGGLVHCTLASSRGRYGVDWMDRLDRKLLARFSGIAFLYTWMAGKGHDGIEGWIGWRDWEGSRLQSLGQDEREERESNTRTMASASTTSESTAQLNRSS